jgi:hypothetical protein
MTAATFRRLALRLPRVVEGAHMGHADFRVAQRVFATLGYPDKSWGMVKLTPEQQRILVESEPELFIPVPGGWGRGGATNVRIAAADRATLQSALTMAWNNVAPKALRAALASEAQPTDAAFARVRACAEQAGMTALMVATSYGTPSLKVKGRLLLRMKDADTLVLRCALEDKELLMAAAPKIYFETDHYKGWPAILIRLPHITDRELTHRLQRAWELVAPKQRRAAAQRPDAPGRAPSKRRPARPRGR